MLCSSFVIKSDGVEFWSWSTSFWKRCWFSCQKFPVFANVYEVKVKHLANQSFLKCDCLHYERSGIPCTNIIKIINQIDETMITVQHQKVFPVHFGLPDWQLSDQLMKAVSMQILHEDLKMPISNAKCMFRECITSQDIHVSNMFIFVLYLIWCFLVMFIWLKMSMDIFTFYSGWINKFIMRTINNIQYSMREQVFLITIRQSMWWLVIIQLQ
jgi:hypothetical protein